MKNSIILSLLIILSGCNNELTSSNKESELAANEKLQKIEHNIVADINQQKSDDLSQGEAFEFTYKNLEGEDVSLSDFRGKWVVVNYWATWCPPCRKEIPDFVKFKKLYSEKVEILGINNEDAETSTLQDFAFEYEINYPVLRADVYNPSEFDRQNTMGLPTTVIFNPEGVEVAKRIGPMHFDDLVEVIGVKSNSQSQSQDFSE